MKCPICGNEMNVGALLIYDSHYMESPVWYPEEERKKKGIGALRRDGEIYIGFPKEYRALSGENHYEAHYCENCQKVIAYFDTKPLEN